MHPTPSHLSIPRDTRAWTVQVWVSFGLAVFLCATGLSWLPGQNLERAFMVMGYVFCLSAAFVLAKFVRDSQRPSLAGDTPMWKLVVWGGFFTAMGLTGWGLVRMEINDAYKATWASAGCSSSARPSRLPRRCATGTRPTWPRPVCKAGAKRVPTPRLPSDAAPAPSSGDSSMTSLRSSFAALGLAGCVALAGLGAAAPARAQSEASAALSLLPLASIVGTASVAGAASTAVVTVPAALSVGGTVLSVVAVEVVADGTVYLLERASDGARASVRVLDRGSRRASIAVGSSVEVGVIGSGIVLSAAGEVLAFIPNAIGQALLYNERVL